MSRDQKRWKLWADQLRQLMMAERVGKKTISIEDILSESGTDKAASTLASTKFWNACILGDENYNAISKAGFELSYEPSEAGKVEAVTFQFNTNWQAILERAVNG